MLSLQLCMTSDENVWTLKHTSFIKIPVRHNEVPIGKTAKSSIRIFRVEGFFVLALRGLSWTPLSFFDPQIQKGEGHVIERETDHQSDAGSDRINLERYGAGRRLRAGPGLAGHFQPSSAKPSLHDRFLGALLIWRGVHLFPWCKRHDGR